jgi:Fe-S cluster assembly protein SufD
MKQNIIVLPLIEGQTTHEYKVAKGASLTLLLTSFGGKNIDSQVTVRLQGAGAYATILGVVVGKGEGTVKINTLQKHEAPDTKSNLLVKSVLQDQARCVIDGGIRVEKNAQKTDAYQRNENLLLSSEAYAESKPSLEILANDVRCTHGATVGPVSEEELWYLSTRGIPKAQAERLVVEGFFSSALELVSDEKVRYRILQEVQNALA